MNPLLKAVVSGATGATGTCLVAELLKSPAFSQVTVIGRRRYEVDPVFNVDQSEAESSGRLVQAVVNFDELTSENGREHFAGADVYFCCLGTTRSKAGSAENFRKIDYHLVLKLAEIAKASDIRHISLVSSVMASASSMFLYLRTKGEADDAVMKMEFKVTTIWRPGTLVRFGGGLVMRTFSRLTMGLPTEQLARALRMDAVAKCDAGRDEKQPADIIGNSGIYALLRAEDAELKKQACSVVAAAENMSPVDGPHTEPSPGDITTPEAATEPIPAVSEPNATASDPASAPADSTLEAAEPTSAAAEPAPEASEPAPEAAEPAPEAAEPAPEATEPATEASGPSPATADAPEAN